MYCFCSKVRYSETGADGHLSLHSAVHYMQDSSTFQSEALGAGIEAMRERKRAWFLTSWQIEVVRRPKLEEEIAIQTWPTGFKGIYGWRNFMIRDSAGKPLICADSVWVYMNTDTGQPMRVDKDLAALYEVEPPLAMGNEGRKITVPESLEEYPAFSVRRTHIDTNGHVNNACYIEMAEEWLTDVRKLRVAYRHAAKYGDGIIPAVGKEGGRNVVVLKGADGQIYAVVEARG